VIVGPKRRKSIPEISNKGEGIREKESVMKEKKDVIADLEVFWSFHVRDRCIKGARRGLAGKNPRRISSRHGKIPPAGSGGSSNGRTTDSGSADRGSNPLPPAFTIPSPERGYFC
jgi:hypothetical protein